MPSFTGYLPPDIIYAISSTRPAWFSSIGTFIPMHEAYDPDSIIGGGDFTNNQPLSRRGFNFTGYIAPAYSDVFYNRILVEPTYINLGFISSVLNRTFIVFNAYLESKALDDIIENNFDSGTQLLGLAAPVAYKALQEETYTIAISMDGPPFINASIVFDWASPIPSVTVTFVGARIVFLPLFFEGNMTETLVFKTDILEAYDGTEHRIRVRNSPRQQFKISSSVTPQNRNHIENLIIGWRKRAWAIPVWSESRVGDDITSGDTIINVDTRYGDFRIGSLAVVWESTIKYDVLQIVDITSNTLEFVQGVNDDYISPSVMPCRSARLLSNPVRKTTGYKAKIDMSFEVLDNITLETVASPYQYLGEDVYVQQPYYDGDGADDAYDHRIDVLDFGSGVVETYAPWLNIKIDRKFELIFESLEEIWNYRLWLHRRAGMQSPFWMPTFESNFIVVSTGFLTDEIRVRENGYARMGTSRDHIAILKTDGTYLFRHVTGIYEESLAVIRLILDANIDIDASQIDEINFIGLKRLASDRLNISWKPNNVAIATVPIKEIEP